MLAKINWTFFVKPDMYDESMSNLVTCVCTHIRQQTGSEADTNDDATAEEDLMEDDFSGRTEHIAHAPMGALGQFNLPFTNYNSN